MAALLQTGAQRVSQSPMPGQSSCRS